MYRSILLSLVLCPSFAMAQDQPILFNAHDLQIAAMDGDIRDPLVLQRPDYMERGEFWFGAVYEYANEPLVRYDAETGEKTDLLRLTSGVHANTGIVIDERLRLSANAPIFFNTRNQEGTGSEPAMGDVAITGMFNLLVPEAEDDGLGLGLTTRVSLPTGAEELGLGEDGVRVEPGLAATYAGGPFTVTANAGLDFRPEVAERGGISNDNRFTAGAGLGYALGETTGVTLESRLAVPLSDQPVDGQATPVELFLTGRQQTNTGLHFVGGGSVGVGPGVGAAEFRLFAGLGLTRRQGQSMDPDGDGIIGDDDLCPQRPERMNGYMDEDGCPDELARVDVISRYQGNEIEGASETVMLGDRRMFVPAGGLFPGDEVTAMSSMGCTSGQTMATMNEGDNDITVQLEAERDHRVIVRVVSRDDTPIGRVSTEWDNPALGCVDADGIAMTDAMGSQAIGDQPLELWINADGFRPVRLTVYQQDQWADNTREYVVELRSLREDMDERQIEVDERVLFDLDKATLRPTSQATLDRVAEEIQATADNEIIAVEGHTDATASERYNQGLSERRARAVVDYLVSKGVSQERLIAEGYGESEPVATNATPEGRQQNRRVVFTVLTPKE